jgi:hypothetical protein
MSQGLKPALWLSVMSGLRPSYLKAKTPIRRTQPSGELSDGGPVGEDISFVERKLFLSSMRPTSIFTKQ